MRWRKVMISKWLILFANDNGEEIPTEEEIGEKN